MTATHSLSRRLLAGLAAATLIATGFGLARGKAEAAGSYPADKVAASGNSIDELSDAAPILTETFKVSSPSDLIINVSAECAILTALDTEGSPDAGASETDSTHGTVEIWVTLDGKEVPVSLTDSDPVAEGVQPDNGKVVFCNRAYERTVSDMEDEQDGIDSESDYIKSRTANAFQWLALNTGTGSYDDAVTQNGNNILELKVWASYDKTAADNICPEDTTDPAFETCSEAFVGARTVIVEPTHVAVNESV